MKLTREEALKLHRQMWSDMQKELGNCPSCEQRNRFKHRWCRKNEREHFKNYWYLDHTPGAMPRCDCYLCEYTKQIDADDCNSGCPIDWGGSDCMHGKTDFRYSPISEILALPEREENIGTN